MRCGAGEHELQEFLRVSLVEDENGGHPVQVPGYERTSLVILIGQEAWAAYLSQRDEMQVKVPVMCSLASSNVVILPKDTVENLDCWMPESVDIFEDHLDIPELESGFINQYNIEGNIS